MAASAPTMMMGRSVGRDGMEDERGGGKKAFVRSYAKVEERRKRIWQSRGGSAVMGCKWKIYRGRIVWEELEG